MRRSKKPLTFTAFAAAVGALSIAVEGCVYGPPPEETCVYGPPPETTVNEDVDDKEDSKPSSTTTRDNNNEVCVYGPAPESTVDTDEVDVYGPPPEET